MSFNFKVVSVCFLGSRQQTPNTGRYILFYDGDGDSDEEEGADGVYDVDSEQTSAKR